jgi:tetratricopeptide (TPR) repeat protein
MRNYYFFISLLITLVGNVSLAQTNTHKENKELMERPLMERFVVDELKSLRTDQNRLRVDVAEKVAQAKVEATDRAVRYMTDTTNNIFYIITAAASLLVLLGWKSIQDVKTHIESVTSSKISDLIESYEKRLEEVENSVKLRSDQLIAAQEEISNTNKLHSLWMRAAIEKNAEDKINLYDEILEMQPDDAEALAYKADALLDMGESKWALSLTDQAIEQDNENSLAYWQRACANADLGNIPEAIDDLEKYITLSSTAISEHELDEEPFLKELRKDERYNEMVSKHV